MLIENDINTSEFTPAVHACVPPLPWSGVTDAERAAPERADLRHLCVCSVDPPGCKDIDDALHVRPLENGNLEARGARRGGACGGALPSAHAAARSLPPSLAAASASPAAVPFRTKT